MTASLYKGKRKGKGRDRFKFSSIVGANDSHDNLTGSSSVAIAILSSSSSSVD